MKFVLLFWLPLKVFTTWEENTGHCSLGGLGVGEVTAKGKLINGKTEQVWTARTMNCHIHLQRNVNTAIVIQWTFLKHNVILYPFGLKSQWLPSGPEFGKSSLSSRGSFSTSSSWCFEHVSTSLSLQELRDTCLPQPAMWLRGSGHHAASYLCLDCLSYFPSNPGLSLLPLLLPKYTLSAW